MAVISIGKTKILFVYLDLSSFVKQDLEILQYHYDVKSVQWTMTGVLTLIKDVYKTDLSFIWFADIHAAFTIFLSKLFGKRSIVVVGGYDVANVPEIDYGLMRHSISARRVKYVLENADKVLTVDDSLKKDAISNAGVSGKNIQTVPTGYDSEKWTFNGKKENMVVSVSIGSRWSRFRLKGLDVFVESARFLPNVKFIVIGPHGEALKRLQSIAPRNVGFVGFLSQDKLASYYQKAKVYCQLSMREGLPNTLCEAMLCECVPVGTNRYGISTAIGDTGFYVQYGDPKATAEAIEKALNSDKGKIARKRIKTMFPLEKREKELVEIINKLRRNVIHEQ